jgi:hypothetical protein
MCSTAFAFPFIKEPRDLDPFVFFTTRAFFGINTMKGRDETSGIHEEFCRLGYNAI